MRYIALLAFTCLLPISGFACTVCKKQQPELLQGITHGAGPQSDWDYVIVGATVVVVILTSVLSICYLFRPGESGAEHIKYSILNPEGHEG